MIITDNSRDATEHVDRFIRYIFTSFVVKSSFLSQSLSSKIWGFLARTKLIKTYTFVVIEKSNSLMNLPMCGENNLIVETMCPQPSAILQAPFSMIVMSITR